MATFANVTRLLSRSSRTFAVLLCLLLGLARVFGIYTVVQERTCRVYMLFGKVLGVLDEPGLHFLLARLGPAARVAVLPERQRVALTLRVSGECDYDEIAKRMGGTLEAARANVHQAIKRLRKEFR